MELHDEPGDRTSTPGCLIVIEGIDGTGKTTLVQALAAWDAYERLGSPEGELAIAQCVIYLATAPKSNAAYRALGAAMAAARETGSLMPPRHILNAPTRLMKELGYGAGYYDRTLATLRRAGDILAIGAAYAAQRMDSLPEGASDQRLDWVVTEEGAIRTGRVAA